MKPAIQLGVLMTAMLLLVATQRSMAQEAYPATAGPYMAVYRWGAANPVGGAGANAAFAQWLNRPVVWAEDFTPNQRWEGHIEGGDWQLKEWGQWKRDKAGRRLVYSVPLLPGPWDRSGAESGPGMGVAVSLKQGAAGEYNEHFRTLAENLVRHGLGDSIVRLGWEFNGGWYTWRAGDDPASYAAYWRQIVRTMRSAPGTEQMMFCWNPAQGFGQFAAEKAWPGDEFVDLVGLDLYDDSWAAETYPWPADATAAEIEARRRKVWNQVLLHGDHGLIFWRDFAIAHGKMFCIPEWGVNRREDTHSGLDNVYFIEQMHQFICDPANRVYFHCYFDVEAPDGGHQLSPGIGGDQKTTFPNAAAKFKAMFGR